MENEIIQRMARAMCIEFGFDWEHEVKHKDDPREGKSSESVPDYRDFIDMARAAIAAMREPTAAMVGAANRNNHPRDIDTWRTMIDAALKSE